MVATRDRPIIGWREWIELPGLLPLPVKAKIDTGARTSAIHCFRIRRFSDGGAPHVAFAILDERIVRSSNGEAETRVVIGTTARLGALEWPIELTLADRDMMGFRMLLGREAIRRRFLIDPGRSFRLSERHPEAIRPYESRRP